jgi:16S rRNA (uracil1498-N3)-methyltransferase
VASAKQCGRAVVPRLDRACRLHDYLPVERADTRVIFVEPHCRLATAGGLAVLEARPKPASAALLIGPEGGWTDEEVVAAAAHGFMPVTLGRRTLRADSAAAAAMAVLLFLWRDL